MGKSKKGNIAARGKTKIHNVRFYNITPRAIQVMAYNKKKNRPRLAIARCDGSIEIWNIKHAAFLERTISETPGKSVEGLAWYGDRLFSTGLTGELVEWNLQTLRPISVVCVTGNAAWCLDVNIASSKLAVGTEQGYISIYEILEDGLQYHLHFDKQQGRVLCCKYDASGDYLVTGSVGCFRIWSTRAGHCVHKIDVTGSFSNKNKWKETIVWSVQVLSDFTILTGDSRGFVSIWDGNNASQLETHQILKADVLAIAVSEEEDRFFCVGIDPTIRIYSKVVIKKKSMQLQRWVRYQQRRIHDHDVRSLIVVNNYMYSGGVDGYLVLAPAVKTMSTLERYGPFLQQSCFSVASNDRFLLMRYPDYLEIWRMGYSSGKPENMLKDNTTVSNASRPMKRLQLVARPKQMLILRSIYSEMIICSEISPSGCWLCYSTKYHIRLFRFLRGVYRGKQKRNTEVICIKDLPVNFGPASHIQFSEDSKHLFLVSLANGNIHKFTILLADDAILEINFSPALDFVTTINTSTHMKSFIRHFLISKCNKYIVAASCDNTIAVWYNRQDKLYKHLLNLPRYSSVLTAMALHGHVPRLVMAFADGKIIEYDFDEMCITCSFVNRFVKNAEHHCITSICLDRRFSDIFIMQNDGYIFVLKKCDKPLNNIKQGAHGGHISKKKAKRQPQETETACKILQLVSMISFQHYIHLCWLSSKELIAIGVNPIMLLEQMPDSFKEKLFRAT